MAAPRHVISLRDLADSDIDWIVHRGAEIAEGTAPPQALLRGRVIGVYFSKTSTLPGPLSPPGRCGSGPR